MRNILFLLPVLFFGAIAGAFYWGMVGGDGEELPSALIGKPAPLVDVTAMNGHDPFAQEDLKSGQVALVNFWASWCAPCRAEHPNLMDMAERGVPIYGVNYRDDPKKAEAFLQELGNPFVKAGADPNAKMALDWGVYGLPETFVLGPDGNVILRVTGPVTQRNIETRILPALAEKGLSIP